MLPHAYVSGKGQLSDFSKKNRRKGPRSQLKAFDAKAYVKVARRKAGAVDRFFNSAQKEKAARDGTRDTVTAVDPLRG